MDELAKLQEEFVARLGRWVDAVKQPLAPLQPARLRQDLAIDRLLEQARADPDQLRRWSAQRRLEIAFTQCAFYGPRDYLAEGDPRRALTLLELAQQIKPDHPQVLFMRTRARVALGALEEAVEDLRRAAALGLVRGAALEADSDLAPLRELPSFRQLLSTLP